MKNFILYFLINLAGVTAVVAQTEPVDSLFSQRMFANKQFIERYKENRDLSYTSPLGEIGAPSKFVIIGRLTTTYMLLGSSKSPVALAVIPDFTVKVRDEKSAGVRTPSFRLGTATYIRLNRNPEHYKYAELAFTHHSNGQDAAALNPDGTINTYNGNFNTNYLTASYRFGNFTQKGAEGKPYYSFNHRAGMEIHRGFSYEPALENDYGFTRILYNFSFRQYTSYPKLQLEKESFRLNTEFSYAINKMAAYNLSDAKKRLNAEVTFNYSFPFMHNVFLMAAAGYYGEDPYNIYYRDHYGYARFGISTGFIRNQVK